MYSKDKHLDVGQHDPRIPSATDSEAIIAEKAPAALAALKKMGAMDLVEAFGLTPYLEGQK